jgi:anaerobic ribonucleoside-triphosphate reductase activating protein
MVRTARETDDITGVTVIGGEPMAQPGPLRAFLAGCHDLGLGTMVFTGYTLDQIKRSPEKLAVLDSLDVLIDGLYRADLPDTRRRFVGSTNQRVHYLTDRYGDDDFTGARTTEFRIDADGTVTINGWPLGSDHDVC